MTDKEILLEFQRMSLEKQLELLEALTHVIRENAESVKEDDGTPPRLERGMLRPDGPLPAEAELGQDYTSYLIRKYL